jgi:hypothetical protein
MIKNVKLSQFFYNIDKIVTPGTLESDLADNLLSLTTCGNSSVGRALPCQGKGRGFESRFPLHFY